MNSLYNKPLNEQKRKIPLTKDFMQNKSVKDIVYSYIQHKSYIDNNKKRFIYYKDFSNLSKVYRDIKELRKDNIPFSDKSFRSYFKTIKELYLTKGKVIDIYGKEVECYYIKDDFERSRLINAETLYYLTVTANLNVIKIYVYLFDKYCYYINEVKENERAAADKYYFTYEELAAAIGYSKGNYNKELQMILKSLAFCGLIDYIKVPIELDNGKKTYRFILKKASEQVREIDKEINESEL